MVLFHFHFHIYKILKHIFWKIISPLSLYIGIQYDNCDLFSYWEWCGWDLNYLQGKWQQIECKKFIVNLSICEKMSHERRNITIAKEFLCKIYSFRTYVGYHSIASLINCVPITCVWPRPMILSVVSCSLLIWFINFFK